MSPLLQLPYLAQWFVRARFFGRRQPLQSVVFATNGCDSTCRHCTVCTRPDQPFFKPLADIGRDLDYCYSQGARLLDIEGPLLLHWQDGPHQADSIFRMARCKGFYSISTMIPAADAKAWNHLHADADLVWLSIKSLHDCTLLEDVPNASIYMVLNAGNYTDLPAVLQFLRHHPSIRQMAFNFHTPFAGAEALALSREQRTEVIAQLLEAKRRGLRIMNSLSGLRNMCSLNFTRHCWICNFIYCDGRRSPRCIDDSNSDLCSHCGFSMAGEMNAVFNLHPDTILSGLRGR